PVGSRVVGKGCVPGHLYPGNRIGVGPIDGPFARHAQQTSFVETAKGLLVRVGSYRTKSMGRKSVVYSAYTSNRDATRVAFRRDYETPTTVAAGDHLGTFNLGSTVILIIEGAFEFADDLEVGQAVRMGSVFGTWSGE